MAGAGNSADLVDEIVNGLVGLDVAAKDVLD